MQLSTRNKGSRGPAAVAPNELARKLTAFFRFVVSRSEGEFLEQVSELDLSITELKTMSQLADSDEALSVKDVAERLGLSLPAASRAVDALVRRKLVARKEDSEDRRVKRVQLTARGRSTADRLMATRTASFERMLGDFSDAERRKLDGAMDAVLANPELSRFNPSGKGSR